MRIDSTENAATLVAAARRQGRVLFALMLRNIRTRFFGHGLGFLIAIGWPLAHILIVVLLFGAMGRSAPFGESAVVFIATGAVPFMIFSYLSRFMMVSVFMARPLLGFPQVKVLDILYASALVEILSSFLVTAILLVLAWFFDVPAMPRDLVEAAYSLGAAMLLGLGFGLLNGVIGLAFPFWMTLYSLVIILLWLSSGTVFVPDSLPEPFLTIAGYHPLLQVIEWMRSAYYEGYGARVLDRAYTLKVALGAVFLGFLLERGTRGHLLAAK